MMSFYEILIILRMIWLSIRYTNAHPFFFYYCEKTAKTGKEKISF
jgi:hypothetical protein